MTEQKEIKFVRLRGDADLIGWVTYTDSEIITIECPLVISVDTLIEEGRQIISLQEYLPQSIVSIKSIDIYSDEIMMIADVNEDFKEQYLDVSDFFYNNKAKIRESKAKKKEQTNEENVISIMEAILDKKNKPVH